MKPETEPRNFWRDVWSLRGAVTVTVAPRVFVFGLVSILVMVGRHQHGGYSLEIGPVELVGATLALLMVLRMNAGYDRWWEGRKLWGGIVNQSRNIVISALSYSTGADPEWRGRFARWTAAFSHVCRHSLRTERQLPEVERLLGSEAAAHIARADHMPDAVASEIARMLKEAVDRHWLSPFVVFQCEKERSLLIDHVGGCERILKSPLPLVYVIKVRRFVSLYLLVLPFSLVDRVGWATPVLTMLVAYPLLGLDQISVELENPFSRRNLGHLPLESICETIESNVLSLEGASEWPLKPSIPERVSSEAWPMPPAPASR
jgi:ion channel-forming bestrophin family protein